MQCLLASSTRDEKFGVFVILVPVLSNLLFFLLVASCVLLCFYFFILDAISFMMDYLSFVFFFLLDIWKSLSC